MTEGDQADDQHQGAVIEERGRHLDDGVPVQEHGQCGDQQEQADQPAKIDRQSGHLASSCSRHS